jgi:hypothetical protein
MKAVKTATMPSLGLKPIIKSCIHCSNFSFGPFYGLPSPSLHSWVPVVMGLKITSSILKSTMGIDGSKEITSSWGWWAMEDEGGANAHTRRRALNFKVCKIKSKTLEG